MIYKSLKPFLIFLTTLIILRLRFTFPSLFLYLSVRLAPSFVRSFSICPCGSHRSLFVLCSFFVRSLFVFCSSFVRLFIICLSCYDCPCGSHCPSCYDLTLYLLSSTIGTIGTIGIIGIIGIIVLITDIVNISFSSP